MSSIIDTASCGPIVVRHRLGNVTLRTHEDVIDLPPDQARALAHILTEHATAADGAEAQQPALTVDLLGRAAYLAYCAATGGRSAVTDERLPPWERLMPELREAWRAAADGVQMVISVGRQ